MVNLEIQLLKENISLPKQAHIGDSGFDVRSLEDKKLVPGQRHLFKLGFCIGTPIGYEVQVRPRSGNALKKGITVLNSPGTIDSGYKGEIGVIIINHSNSLCSIKEGDKIAQLVIQATPRVTIVQVEVLSKSERGNNGFGSSGK